MPSDKGDGCRDEPFRGDRHRRPGGPSGDLPCGLCDERDGARRGITKRQCERGVPVQWQKGEQRQKDGFHLHYRADRGRVEHAASAVTQHAGRRAPIGQLRRCHRNAVIARGEAHIGGGPAELNEQDNGDGLGEQLPAADHHDRAQTGTRDGGGAGCVAGSVVKRHCCNIAILKRIAKLELSACLKGR